MEKENEKLKILLLTKPVEYFEQKYVYSKSKILQFVLPKLDFKPKIALFKHSTDQDTKVAEMIEINLKRDPEKLKDGQTLYTFHVNFKKLTF